MICREKDIHFIIIKIVITHDGIEIIWKKIESCIAGIILIGINRHSRIIQSLSLMMVLMMIVRKFSVSAKGLILLFPVRG